MIKEDFGGNFTFAFLTPAIFFFSLWIKRDEHVSSYKVTNYSRALFLLGTFFFFFVGLVNIWKYCINLAAMRIDEQTDTQFYTNKNQHKKKSAIFDIWEEMNFIHEKTMVYAQQTFEFCSRLRYCMEIRATTIKLFNWNVEECRIYFESWNLHGNFQPLFFSPKYLRKTFLAR